MGEFVFLFAPFHAGEIEDVVDEPGEPRGFGGDDVEISPLFPGSVTRSSASNSANIRIEVSGVFNSWETLLTKSVFWRASSVGSSGRHDEPASDADGQDQHGDYEAEREPAEGARP